MKLKPLFLYLLLFFACLSFVCIFSWSTSPIYGGRFEGIDSAVFKVVGKYWAVGDFPYVDLWDQKGPLIHAINALGYKLIGSDLGVFYIQVISLYITALFIYRSLKLAFTIVPSLLLTCFIVLSLSVNYDGGNLVEEYLLPFISISYYLLLKYLIKTKPEVTDLFLFCFFVGLSLAFSLFTRLTNALGLCASEFVICLMFLCKRKYKLFLSGTLCTLLGFVVITIPVISYFYYHSALSEMWYGAFGYNLEYAASLSNNGGSLFYFLTSYLNCFVLIIISIWLLVKRNIFEGFLWIMTALLPLVWFAKGAGFSHYGMIVFQYICISFVLLKRFFNSNLFLTRMSIASVICMTTIGICVRTYYSKNVFLNVNGQKQESRIENICQKYNVNKNSLILYNYPGPEYIVNNIKPGMRFFYLHDFLMSHGPSIEPKMLKSLSESKVAWIIAKDDVKNKRAKEYIDNHYDLIANEANIVVYKLKE